MKKLIEKELAEAIKNRSEGLKRDYRFWDGKVCAYEQLLEKLKK